MSGASLNLRVATVRVPNRYATGGAIFTGVELDTEGQRRDASVHYVVLAPSGLLLTEVQPGQLWRIEGQPEPNTIVVNGFQLTELTIKPTAMELLRPSGEHIIRLLADSLDFQGIGLVKARRLWDRFGDDLYGILDAGNRAALSAVLPETLADTLIAAWQRWGNTFSLQWLQTKGFPVALGRKLLDFYGQDLAAKIEEDPYRLISFAGPWGKTDALAQETFGLAPDDPRRTAGAMEEVLYQGFDRGHTYLPETDFKHSLRLLLGTPKDVVLTRALDKARALGRFVQLGDRIHAPGPLIMEQTIAEAIAARLAPAPLLAPITLDQVIAEYQQTAGIIINPEQDAALRLANTSPLAIITGGAGTGKTTVLRGLIQIAQVARIAVFPMALSGRAAKRIREATGHPAQTIAGFLQTFGTRPSPQRAIVIIDEASMLDLPSAYRVVRRLPEGYRLVLVGDPHQLPPVGPGLVLHELAHHDGLPRVELSQVKRYGGAIAEAAAAIRQGVWPELPEDHHAPVAFVSCAPENLHDIVLRLYDADRAGTQLLSPTRNAAQGGVNRLNPLCCGRVNAGAPGLRLWSLDQDQAYDTGLHVGDPVICTRNDWDLDLQNGSLGILESVEPPSRDPAPDRVVAHVRWDDGRLLALTADFQPHLELAYAIAIDQG
ncbi:MAG: exonuclease V subunit alpha, partial [Gammaproteobacteria bacterium]|nr:exonuclease V subunit alpha [Gammaproteobacteria bacterium]